MTAKNGKMTDVQRAVLRKRRCSPLKRQCDFASFVPEQAVVSRRLRKAAGTLHASRRTVSSQNTLTLISTKN